MPTATAATAPDQAQVLRERVRTASLAAALAEEALAESALARSAATAAQAALPPMAALHPADGSDDLAAGLGGAGVVAVPGAARPDEVGAWWAALSLPAQLAAVRGCPQLVGSLDGVPAWARDRANRELLRRALTAPEGPGSAAARTVSGALAAEEQRGDTAQLLEFDAATGRAAVVLGDLDAATEVGVLVPGMGVTVSGDLGPLLADARGVRDAALTATPTALVATVAWLAYRPPRTVVEADSAVAARRGGALLDRTLAGLRASREGAGLLPARTTVLAHSYGTLVAREAARQPGRLAADAVVLLGSPGMGLRGAASLESPEVYAAGSLGDPVSYLGRFGVEPTVPWYGATRLPTDTWETHGSYYDPRHPTLAALGRVVAGTQPHR